MPRDIDLYNIGPEPESLLNAILDLRRDFDSHQHDGSNSRSFQVLNVETLIARTSVLATTSLSVTKKSYTDDTAGFWVGIHSGVAKLYVGTSSNFVKWDGSTLSINGSITATTGTIGGFTIGATSLSTSGVVISSAAVSAASGTIKIDGANTKLYAGSSLTIDGAGTGTITGGTIRTAASGARVEMDGANTDFRIYDATQLVATIFASSASLWLSHEISTGNISFATNDALAATIDQNGNFALAKAGADIFIPSTGTFAWLTHSNFIQSNSAGEIETNAELNLGSAGDRYQLQGIRQPKIYTGYVASGGTFGVPAPSGWSVSNDGTGLYTVTHNLGTTNYVVMVTPLASLVKHASIQARSSNTFQVRTASYTEATGLENNDFMFVLYET